MSMTTFLVAAHPALQALHTGAAGGALWGVGGFSTDIGRMSFLQVVRTEGIRRLLAAESLRVDSVNNFRDIG